MKKVVRILGVAVFCFVVSIGVHAQEAAAPVDEGAIVLGEAAPGGAAAANSSLLPYMLRMFLVLGLVLGLIYGLYAVLKRAAKPQADPASPIRVLASRQIGAGKELMVATIGARAWLLGVSDASIQALAELDDKELIDELTLKAQAEPEAAPKDFAAALAALIKPKGGTLRPKRSSDFLARQRDRLKRY